MEDRKIIKNKIVTIFVCDLLFYLLTFNEKVIVLLQTHSMLYYFILDVLLRMSTT